MRRPVRRALSIAVFMLSVLSAHAAAAVTDKAERLRGLGLADSVATGPSPWRVLVVFLFVVALGWGAIWLLKRQGFRTPVRAGAASSSRETHIVPIARSVLPGGVTCHVIEAQGRSVLITVTRNGVASLVLRAHLEEGSQVP